VSLQPGALATAARPSTTADSERSMIPRASEVATVRGSPASSKGAAQSASAASGGMAQSSSGTSGPGGRTSTGEPVALTEIRELGTDRAYRPLLGWCTEAGGEICVMASGRVLYAKADPRGFANLRALIQSRHERDFPTGIRLVPARQGLISKILEDARAETVLQASDGPSHEELSQARQRLRSIVASAVERDVSDVHLEIRGREAVLKFRRYGMLEEYERWPSSAARAIAAAAFNFDTDQADGHLQPTRPQDASMSIEVQVGGRQRTVRMRVGTGPISLAGGQGSLDQLPFDMVLRILEQGDVQRVPKLQELGYTSDQRHFIERSINRPHGMILVCGPTGSGKSTTLAACIGIVARYRKIYTVEDPVERLLPNASQMPVEDSKADTTFAGLVKATMRLDPDVLMVGEVRDEETAENMVRAAITGHLVLSTLHVSGVTKVVPRLENLGVTREILANPDVLELLVYQRLVPLLCSHCRVPLEAHRVVESGRLRELLSIVGDPRGVYMCNPQGCERCDGRGIAGRSVLAEVLPIDDRGREFVQRGDMLGWERDLLSRGWHTIAEHALQLVRLGQVDLFHAQEAAGFRTAGDKLAIDFASHRQALEGAKIQRT
jgi:type II secretory ATPase GspE/PulE/Tfp pilus assembly ATPase PilB-like protein